MIFLAFSVHVALFFHIFSLAMETVTETTIMREVLISTVKVYTKE